MTEEKKQLDLWWTDGNLLAEGSANAPINQELLLPTDFTYKTCQGAAKKVPVR